jgi:hypothetical protein
MLSQALKNQRAPLGRVVALFFVVVSLGLAGCDLLGTGDPRPDDPNAVRPPAPAGAVIWSSLAWQPVSFDQPTNPSVDRWDRPSAIAAGPGGFVAVGSNFNVTGDLGRIWHSQDSLRWSLAGPSLMAGLDLASVAATGTEYIAVGTRSVDFNNPTTLVFRSEDGVVWAETASFGGAWAQRVASGPAGFALIVGVGDTTDVLFSPDGRAWKRVSGAAIASGVSLSDIAWDGIGWVAAGAIGTRAVVLRSADGTSWSEDRLPASEPIPGIIDVAAYRVIPGKWATLLLGLEREPACTKDDDFCGKYQAAWSWTAATGWVRLPRSTWILRQGYGVDVFAAGDAGFLYVLAQNVRDSSDGWTWIPIKMSGASPDFPSDVVVTRDRVVGVGSPANADSVTPWFGSSVISR